MPYDNEYNRRVAAEVNYLNRKYVTHSDATGQGTIDYTQSANLSGSGISGSAMTGMGRSGGVAEYKGASASKNHYYEDDSSSSEDEGGAMSGGTGLGHPKQCSNETGQFDELQGGAILGLQSGTVIDGKKGRKPTKGRVNSMLGVKASFGTLGVPADDSKTREMVAMASTPAANARLGIASKPVGSAIEGGKGGYAEGTFRDTGFGSVEGAKGGARKKRQTKKSKEDEKLAMELKGLQDEEKPKKKGRKKKVSKKASKEGGVKSMGEMIQERKKQKEESEKIRQERETKKGRGRPKKEGGANPRMVGGTTTNTKKTLQSTSKAVLSAPVPKAQMPSSTLSGFGKKKGNRAEIVRKVMKDKGLKLIEASKYVKEHNLY